jgi:molecular chaperone HtpG
MSEENAPIVITQPEFIRRMMEQQKLGGGGGFYGAFPEMFTMTINSNHPAVSGLTAKPEKKQQAIIKQLTDLALLSQGLLKGEALSSFIERNLKGIA